MEMSSIRVKSKVGANELVSSTTWLQSHGLRKKKLTLPKILAQLGFQHKEDYENKLGRPVSSRYAHGLFHQYNFDGKIYNLTAKKEHFLQKIHLVADAIELYKQRLAWLAGGSRLTFGVIQEQSVVFILDFNTVTKLQYDRSRDAFCNVLREQVAQISKFNLIWVSLEPVKWHQKTVRGTRQSIEAAVEWVSNLPYTPVDNLDSAAEALSQAVNDQVEAVYYFSVGDISDGKESLLVQSFSSSPRPIHAVSYNPQSSGTITFWKELRHQSSGRFHLYSEQNKNTVRTLTQHGEDPATTKPIAANILPECDLREDQLMIRKEMDEAENTLKKLHDILKAFYDPDDENSTQPMPEPGPDDYVSSKEWLKKFGLKPQKLRFYDALADCAFRHSDGVVDIKTKPEDESVQTDAENNIKFINAKYCDRFVHTIWKDGSVVHLYVSKEKCRWYEEKMKAALELMERRVKWLQKGSRELFGTILEDQIYILIDVSHSMKEKLFLVKEKIFQLMEEQLRYKKMFNFVKFDSKVEAWKSQLAEATENNLRDAWFWVKELQVGSSTNTLRALQVALADSNTQAVYLLTDGRPDQPSSLILNQLNLQQQVPIHTISFNCDDTEANNFLYELSKKTGGRFHCYNSYLKDSEAPQPFVSEDIQLLVNEIEMGKADLEKIQKVHSECLMLDWYHNGEKDISHTSFQFHQKSLVRSQSAHELTATAPLLHRPRLSAPKLLQRNKARHAAQTKSSLLRALSHGVNLSESSVETDMPTETKDLFNNNNKKTAKVLKELKIVDGATSRQKVKRLTKDSLDVSSGRWLKTRGLVAKRLTIMDVLGPTTVPHTAKYVPILDKHILSKVFNEIQVWSITHGKPNVSVQLLCVSHELAIFQKLSEAYNSPGSVAVLPLAHINGNRKLITLINPQAVNLSEYKQKLARAIGYYERRLNLVIWRALSQEERDKFESDTPISYLENKEALLQALDRLGWPIPLDDVMLLEEEIEAGKRYLQQASDLQEAIKSKTPATATKDIKNENPKMKQSKKVLDTMRSQRVIARSEVGFYYQGTVVRSISSKLALVDFCQGENQIVPIKFIIQTGGAVSCPPLKVGDFVFSKTGTGSGCYVPAVVIATPRTEAADKLYSVLKYNNRKEHRLRSELIKISPSLFAYSCRYIRKAQMVDFSIPNVQIVKPLMKLSPPGEEMCKRSKKGRRRNLSEEKSPVDKPIACLETDSKEEDGKNENTGIHKKLEDFISQIMQYQEEQRTQQQAVQEYLKEIAMLRSHQDKCPSEEEIKDISRKQLDLLQQLERLMPASNIQQKKEEVSKDQAAMKQQKPGNVDDSPLVPNQKVMALCTYNGWYEEGSIVHDCGDQSYFVQMSSGEMSRMWKEDIFSDTDDYEKDIQEGETVIAPYPQHIGSYCPAIVLKVMADFKLMVQYYDHTEDWVARERVYSMSRERYERDTAYILECEKRWLGQAVVARNNETGTFHLAEVQRRVGSGRQYAICWTDGSMAIQDIDWIFGKFSQPHVLDIGHHILTLASPSSLTFLPGVITGSSGKKLHVEFCNGKSCQSVESHHCFGLSESKFYSAVQFYHQHNQRRTTDGEDTISENEDSHSDISSITLTSTDSDEDIYD
ncbi:von Willebrand factor A domain-containing protein 3B [Spea bombifrons]|uniref:von Willebrand factor A domain-containing protein 3B n=1 Tax=Spea bombifrons TaxID=233779 RepID=UPI002349C8C9|nr:von Willebrand factor A domain-containing protein 3B [Spea bombifrons]